MACARFHVSGRVQGVFFRASTRVEAMRLDIRGYARNLRDGRVEVLAQGTTESLLELEAWLQHGPEGARVTAVLREDIEEQSLTGFQTH